MVWKIMNRISYTGPLYGYYSGRNLFFYQRSILGRTASRGTPAMSISIHSDSITLSVSVSGGVYQLNNKAVSPGSINLPVGTTVTFADIPEEHPLRITGPSGDSKTLQHQPIISFKFSKAGAHSMHCILHGYMGGQDAINIYTPVKQL
jgi:plastocyanin